MAITNPKKLVAQSYQHAALDDIRDAKHDVAPIGERESRNLDVLETKLQKLLVLSISEESMRGFQCPGMLGGALVPLIKATFDNVRRPLDLEPPGNSVFFSAQHDLTTKSDIRIHTNGWYIHKLQPIVYLRPYTKLSIICYAILKLYIS